MAATCGAMCSRCGELRMPSEWPPSKGPGNGWCNSCYREWHRVRYTPKGNADDSPRNCTWCGESYRPKQRRASTYCSRTCKDEARKASAAVARATSKPRRQCIHCTGEMPRSMRSDARFCSAACNSAAHQLKRKLRNRGGDSANGYVRIEIAERDGWRCGICHEAIESGLKHPDPGCLSLDHIVPVSLGGTSAPENLQASHLSCNLRRRATPLAGHIPTEGNSHG